MNRSAATRQAILSTAERLLAEHGVSVSHRRIAEEAGLGNIAAVGYHFGSKEDLVRAVVRSHTEPIERLRDEMVTELGEPRQVRDWVACMVHPHARHLAELGSPTWFGRFGAQILTDPVYGEIMVTEALQSHSLLRTADGINACLPELPPKVRLERNVMARQLIVHMFAERERALAEGNTTVWQSWEDAASGLIDAITGLWTADVTREEK